MLVLGIEGTAHTVSAGLVDEDRILSTVSSTYSSGSGGIHPREAATHHSEKIVPIIQEALSEASVNMEDVDLIAFSRGPGLGPCLRVVGTAARSLALKFDTDIIGVNHPLGHVEIGRRLGKMEDPIVLYVSGGNTQVLAHTSGRYRVMGETMDIGLGNMLDKFARDMGTGFPGGPEIERLALGGNKLLDLPYSVKGMDTSFSGIYTASKSYLSKGERKEDIAMSIQETSFAMLIEVLERALYYFDKKEVLLAGGVAANSRLRDMLTLMGNETGTEVYLTEKKYCMDNGAMIAQAGMLMHKHGERHSVRDSTVDQRFRIDEVDTPWIRDRNHTGDRMKGAESQVERESYFGRTVVVKQRRTKPYRLPQLDGRILRERTRNEASLLIRMRNASVPVPLVYDADPSTHRIVMQEMEGMTLRSYLAGGQESGGLIEDLGKIVAEMHNAGIAHGDLTTNNIMISEGASLIDASLGKVTEEPEDLAADLFLLLESFKSNHSELPGLGEMFLQSYRRVFNDPATVMSGLESIEKRRRYV